MRSVNTAVPVATVVLLSGCMGFVKDSYRVDTVLSDRAVTTEEKKELHDRTSKFSRSEACERLECFNLDTDPFPEERKDETPIPAYKKVIEACADSSKTAQCKTLRDRLQLLIMRKSDVICDQHKSDITAQAAAANFGLTTTSVALSTTSAIISGEEAKSILSGLSAFTGATQSALNENIYQQFLAPAVIRAIEDNRRQQEQIINAKRDLPGDKYLVDEALRDAAHYHYQCSFYQGLKALTSDSEKRFGLTGEVFKAQMAAIRNEIDTNRKMVEADHSTLSQKEREQEVARVNAELEKKLEDVTKKWLDTIR